MVIEPESLQSSKYAPSWLLMLHALLRVLQNCTSLKMKNSYYLKRVYYDWTKTEPKLSHSITTNKRQKKQKLQPRPSAGKETEVGTRLLLISLLIGCNSMFALIVEGCCTSSFGPITEFVYYGKYLFRKQKRISEHTCSFDSWSKRSYCFLNLSFFSRTATSVLPHIFSPMI